MGSKYDDFWAGQLAQIRAQMSLAAAGKPVVLSVPGLSRLGARQSWHGMAEVRAQEITRSSGAHATSLGKMVAASGICGQWPDRVFLFTISTAGDLLTITPTARSQDSRPSGPRLEPAGNSHPRSTSGDRKSDADEFYRILNQLAARIGGPRHLRDCTGKSGCPPQGVYFFYEDGENRADGSGRVVRVGTHALTETSKATLWGRLRQHRGQLNGRDPGGGRHRASVFRRHVGAALIRRDSLPDDLLASWLDRHRPRNERSSQEADIEREVSQTIGAMPFLWLGVPGRADRGYIESNSIALLSCLADGPDLSGTSWLGHHAARPEISESGLWNIQHIYGHYEPAFLQRLAQLVNLQE